MAQAVPGLRVERIPFAMSPARPERDRSIEDAAAVLAAYLGAGEEVAFKVHIVPVGRVQVSDQMEVRM